MIYLIYKITNLVNGKFYVGKHQTEDIEDGYEGSGKLLKRAIKKHESKNFVKEILGVYASEVEMNLAERILVVVDEEVSYNLCPGGKGGWGYINENGLQNTPETIEIRRKNGKKTRQLLSRRHVDRMKTDEEYRERVSQALKNRDGGNGWRGKKHTEETRLKMSRSHNSKSHPVGVKRGPYKKGR